MANLTREDILRLAELAQLELSDQEISQFQKEISEILQYVEQLQSAEVSGLEPTNQVTGLSDVTRPDTVIDYGITTEQLFKNVPNKELNQIKVKRVLG